jgi:myo-inositol-1(or 4)-monophosphatase
VQRNGQAVRRRRLRPAARRAVRRHARRRRDLQRPPLRVSDERELGRALLATGFAYDVHKSPQDNLDHFASFVKRVRGLRRDGSAALDLCYVAAGRFDGFWELKLHPWDVAAGNLLVEEAGGRTSDLSGRPPTGDGRETVASNGHLHDAIVRSCGRR